MMKLNMHAEVTRADEVDLAGEQADGAPAAAGAAAS
jgi:hypothetical protein